MLYKNLRTLCQLSKHKPNFNIRLIKPDKNFTQLTSPKLMTKLKIKE